MRDTLIVSDGREFHEIDADDFASAADAGFYRPEMQGRTIVGDGRYHFEIPSCDVTKACENGFVDLLCDPSAPSQASSQSSDQPDASTSQPIPSPPDQPGRFTLLAELNRAEQLAQQDAIEQQDDLESASGLNYYRVFARQWLAARRVFLERQLGSHGISIAIHVAIFLLLASLVLVDDRQQKSVLIASVSRTSNAIEEIIIEPESLEITEPKDSQSQDSPPESEEVEIAITQEVAIDFMGAVSIPSIKPPAAPSKTNGKAMEVPKKTASAVFGTKQAANDYIFVIDNSNSMSRGRFETALHELMIAVNGLNKKQRFYVIFYSDCAYPMMYPNSVTQMAYATNSNKQRLFLWLNTVQLCLKTNGKEAIEAAFKMDPDVIYVLGDGAFTDKASRHFASQPRGRTILNTRGMQVAPNLAKSFEALAKAHGGDYKDVGVLPAAAARAKAFPIPRNNKRNGVWGRNLPVQ
ncbi:vWA domain-containing protein [Planctomycetes bacterium K23_9]|uniref:VWFA domain-containing protein n=1 Tax=Stieleria marina TaxID=1930275 RepID=A0A517NRG8_9BACT|nr:hypothetical protein K239x_16790 [Planctomycetes bacterium K23_9]